MYKALIFAGTTEGYALCRFLSENHISVYACVATDYGSRSLEANEYLTVSAGRLDEVGMEELLQKTDPQIVLDATHPYAAEVTVNIRNACSNTGIQYQRVLREGTDCDADAVYVENTQAAIDYLNTTEGNILLTTGSKELAAYRAVHEYEKRLYARVLSLPSVMESCAALGFEGKHLIGMQGPFSKELNAAMLRQYNCRYLVTKDTGKAGGFEEKIDAALECGVIPVIIGRPLQEEGMSLMECRRFLADKFQIECRPHITLLGIGMGSPENLTVEGKKALDGADLLIGARRMLDSVKKRGQSVYCEYRSEEICKYIQAHREYENIVIVLSGDVGFYSGARKLLNLLGEDVEIICGISSVVYFMAKIGLSWDDAKIVSAHGRNCNLVSCVKYNQKVFAILGTSEGVSVLAKKLVDYGMGEVLLYVGENLSYENEKIFVKPAKELTDYTGDALSVVCAYHEKPVEHLTTHGIKDEDFIRGKAPMTKEEVRTVSLSKLRLQEDSVCYDVGAGTGSVSIEMALRVPLGCVYAIEKKEEAVALIKENKIKFAADNLEIISGTAPEALCDLPVPTHAFIGGSSGNMKQIIGLLLDKNPYVRIVVNCITLETVTEALEAVKAFGFEESEIVQLNVSRSKSVGRYHMMMGENPIYVITMHKSKEIA